MTDPAAPESPREATLRAIAMGVLFGALFGAANAYLGLRVGMTVATSIPVAVMTVAVLRAFGARASVLEANLAQTIGSASTALATGAIFTLPALWMWGQPPSYLQVAGLALCGGVLGVSAMIPLRRLLIVRADAELPYPEGRACAEVLRATTTGAGGGAWIFRGLLIGAAIKLVLGLLEVAPDQAAWRIPGIPNGELSIEIAPALIGVGFILGYRQAAVCLSGGMVSALLLMPLVTLLLSRPLTAILGDATAVIEPAFATVKGKYVRFVGIGAVACAGIVAVARLVPAMTRALVAVIRGLTAARTREPAAGAMVAETTDRTDRDVPGWVVGAGVAAVVAGVVLVPGLLGGDPPLAQRLVLGAGIALLGLVFVAVASRIVGLIGVSSQPTSGICLMTLLSLGLLFTAFDWTSGTAKLALLTAGTVVATAASKAGDISQDLKTGFLVGATPRTQQLGQYLGAATACWAVAATILFIGASAKFGEDPAAPQATMMKTVIEGQLSGSLPWALVLAGAGLAAAVMLAGLQGLAFAIGVYLPLSSLTPIFLGGVIRRIVDARRGESENVASAGILAASGLVAGEGLAGVVIAGLVGGGAWTLAKKPELAGNPGLLAALALVTVTAWFLHRAGRADD